MTNIRYAIRTAACNSAGEYALRVATAIEAIRRVQDRVDDITLPFQRQVDSQGTFDAWLNRWRSRLHDGVPLLRDYSFKPGLVFAIGERVSAAASLLAHLSGRHYRILSGPGEVLEALEEEEASSECVVLLRDDLTVALSVALAARTRRSSVGVIVADSVAELTQLIVKTLVAGAPRNDGDYLVLKNGTWVTRDVHGSDAINVVEATNLSPGDTVSLLSSPWRFLALEGDGNPVDSSVSHDAVLCGRPSVPMGELSKGGSHFCASMTFCARRSRGQNTIFSADQLSADFIFLNSCFGSVSGESPYARTFTLTSAIQRSPALGFLSNIKQASVPQWLGLLCAAQARSGLALGAIAQRASRIHEQVSKEPPSLLLFADPVVALSPLPLDCDAHAAKSVTRRADLRATGYWTEVHFPASALNGGSVVAQQHFRAQLTEASQGDHAEVFAGLNLLQGGGASVDVFSVRPLNGRALSLEVSSFATEFDAICAKVLQIDRQLAGLDQLCLTSTAKAAPADSPSARFLESMKHLRAEGERTVARLLAGLAVQPSGTCLEPDQKSGPEVLSRALEASVARVRDILDSAPQWDLGCYLGAQYAGNFLQREEREAGPCVYCGRPTFKTTLVSLRRADVERFTHWCPGCTLISDSSHDGAPIVIEGPASIRAGGEATYAPRFSDDHRPGDSVADILLPEGNRMPWLKLACERIPDSRTKKGPAELSRYRISVGDTTPPGAYYLILLVARDFGITVAVRMLQIS